MPLYAVSKGRFTFGPFTSIPPGGLQTRTASNHFLSRGNPDTSALLSAMHTGSQMRLYKMSSYPIQRIPEADKEEMQMTLDLLVGRVMPTVVQPNWVPRASVLTHLRPIRHLHSIATTKSKAQISGTDCCMGSRGCFDG